MKAVFSALIAISMSMVSYAKAIDQNHLLLHGRVYEVNPFSEEIEGGAKAVQVIIYQNAEIYVAFYTDKTGNYEFNLPIGFLYDVRYGGTTYINKIVQIDARQVPAKKDGADLKMDMGLFRPVDGADFSLLNEPFVVVNYDKEVSRLIPDLAYTDDKAYQLDKIFRKLKKTKVKN